MKMVNKRVRAFNLKAGDVLDWFDSKAKEAVVMVYGSPRNSLVRVRREK